MIITILLLSKQTKCSSLTFLHYLITLIFNILYLILTVTSIELIKELTCIFIIYILVVISIKSDKELFFPFSISEPLFIFFWTIRTLQRELCVMFQT